MRGEVDVPAMLRLARLIGRERFSIVHAQTSHAHTLGSVAARLLGYRRRPRMLVTRRVDFSIFRNSFFGLNRFKYLYGVDAYVTVSDAIRQVMIHDGVPASRIETVHSGIDVSKVAQAPDRSAELRAELGVPDGHALVATVGHMADHKGQRYLIDAIPQILAARPKTTFMIVGDGELRSDLVRLAERLGVSASLKLPGFRTDVPSLLKAMDVFVMPSHMEGLGTSVLDAMAAGVPVVGTEAGGMPESILDEVTGLVCPIRDSSAIAVAVLRMLDDEGLALRCVSAARAKVKRDFSTAAMIEGTLGVYRRLLDARRT